jgi:hypothetical protein
MNTADIPTKACLHCARTHKKCDRRVPRCSLCITKGRDCIYEKSKRNTAYHPYQEKQPIEATFDNTALDEVVTFRITIDMPILSREKFSQIFKYIYNEYKGTPREETTPNPDELALVYAIQAGLNECYGHHETAEYMYEKGRALLEERFESIDTLSVATSYVFLALYCGINGDANRAASYLSTVELFMNSAQFSEATAQERFLMHMYQHINNILKGESDMEIIVKCIVAHHNLVRQFNSHNSKDPVVTVMLETDVESEDKVKIMRKDVCQRTNVYELNENKVTLFSNKFANMYEQLRLAGIPDKFVNSKKLSTAMYFQGLLLQRSLQAGNLEMARESADVIARLITAPGFSDVLSMIAPVVCMAAKAHVEAAKNTNDIVQLLKIADYMRMELLSIYMISERNKLLKSRCDELVDALLTQLRRTEEEMMAMHVTSRLFQPISPLRIPIPHDEESESNALAVPIDNDLEAELFDAVDLFFEEFA